MRLRDWIGLALFALARHKLRTTLTTLGVLFGTLVLTASLAIRSGVHDTIVRQVSKYAELRRIEVHPGPGRAADKEEPLKGEMSAARRERLQRELRRRSGGGEAPPPPRQRLTRQRLDEIAAMPHVVRVEPVIRYFGEARLGDGRGERTHVLALPTDLRDHLQARLVAGALPGDEEPGALVSEALLYRLGVLDEPEQARSLRRPLTFSIPLRDTGRVGQLLALLRGGAAESVGRKDEEALEKVVARLRPSLKLLGLPAEDLKRIERLLGPEKKPNSPGPAAIAAHYPIVGILRAPTPEESRRRGAWAFQTADVVISRREAEALAARVPWTAELGHGEAIVEVDDRVNVKEVQQALRERGLGAHSAIEYIEREQFTYLVVFTAMTVVALVALMVAAIGITNTMLMSVLERVREIGIMKAVGARDGHIQGLFLLEGGLIGAVGGLLGLLAAWGLTFPADAYLRRLVAQRLNVQLDGSLFAFPWWVLLGAPLFAVALTTLAAWWPARRAVRIDPVQALRHE